MKHNIDSRKEKILELVIEDYINTASPISSRAVSRRLRSSISPATVRNVMADLEDAGLITHPHTSAGRTPTDKGYRYYVDKLMQARLLTQEEKKKISNAFKQKFDEVDEVIQNTSRLLSSIAEEVGLITFPVLEKGAFKHIELIEIDKNKVLVVLVTKNGLVKNILVEFDKPVKKSDLNKIAGLLNTRFRGVSLHEIKKAITQQLLVERDALFYILDETKRLIDLILKTINRNKICIEGTSKVVMQPEFKYVDKVKSLLNALETPEVLNGVVDKNFENENVGVYIGDEIEIDQFCDCSIVISDYAIKEDRIGALGIIGPKRMPYARMVALVQYVSNTLSEVLG